METGREERTEHFVLYKDEQSKVRLFFVFAVNTEFAIKAFRKSHPEEDAEIMNAGEV